MGTVYLRGRIWWIKYSQSGRAYYESTESRKKSVAKEILKQREGEIVEGKLPGVLFKKTTFRDLKDEFIDDYKINQRKSLERAEISAKHLGKFFSGYQANQITTAAIKKYVKKRKEVGSANGTINRELRALGRMLSIGYEDGKVARIPHIPMLKESNPRVGFFEHEDYFKLYKALPEELKPVAAFAYTYGWRKSEILGLVWDRVDLNEKTVRLEAGETKNDEARTIYIEDELVKVLKLQKLKGTKGYVFHRNGRRIKDFRGAWKKACKDAKIGIRLFHDFRRTAVRNMVRSGIPERVAMMISGHKTRSVFDRYNIVSPNDLKMAAEKMKAFSETVTKTVTIKPGAENAATPSGAQVIEMVR